MLQDMVHLSQRLLFLIKKRSSTSRLLLQNEYKSVKSVTLVSKIVDAQGQVLDRLTSSLPIKPFGQIEIEAGSAGSQSSALVSRNTSAL